MKPEDIKPMTPYNSFNVELSVNGGVIVRVGCATFTFSDVFDFTASLHDYIADPGKFVKAYSAAMKVDRDPHFGAVLGAQMSNTIPSAGRLQPDEMGSPMVEEAFR